MVSGKMTRNMVMECLSGLMVLCMMVSGKMAIRMVMECLSGLMVGCMIVSEITMNILDG